MSIDVSAIKIKIDTGDLQTAKNALDKLESQAKKTDSSVKGLSDSFLSVKTAVAAVATSAVISNYIKMADTFSSIDSKLKNATSSTLEFNNAQKQLFSIAQQSRTSFESTIDLYSKLSTSTKNLQVSQEQLFQITDTINKAGVIGGGSKESINAALVQLGQAFSAGTLRGEELNSILEQTPRLARAIAEGLNVTTGELKKMGETGTLTADKVMNALLSQSQTINSEFSNIKMTVSQSLTVLENSTIKAIGQFDNLAGITGHLSNAMSALAKGFDMVSNAMKNYELASLRIQDVRKVTAIDDMKKAIELIDKENEALTTSTEIQDVLKRSLMSGTQIDAKLIENKVKKRDLTKQLNEAEKELANNSKTTGQIQGSSAAKNQASLEMTIATMSDYNKKLYEIEQQYIKWVEAGVSVDEALKNRDILVTRLNEKTNASAIKKEIKDLNEASKAYSDLAKKGMTEYEQKLFDLKLEYVDFIKKTGDMKTGLEILAKAEENLNNKYSAEQQKKRNEDLDKQISALKDIYDLKEKQAGLLLDENEKNQTLAKLYYERRVQEIALEKEKGDKNAEYYKQSEDYEKSLLEQTLFRYSATGQIIESVSSGMKSSMMDFFDYTSSGFGNLKKLALDLGNMIYKAVTQQMVVNPLVGALQTAATSYFAPSTSVNIGSSASANASALGIGGTDSNFMSSGSTIFNAKGGTYSSQSLSSYSNGIYSTPQVFAFAKGGAPNIGVFGEAGAEAIMPLTRDSSGSLGVKAVGGSSNGVVKVEVINQSSQEVQVTNTSTRQSMEGLILSVVINGIQNNKMGLRTALGK